MFDRTWHQRKLDLHGLFSTDETQDVLVCHAYKPSERHGLLIVFVSFWRWHRQQSFMGAWLLTAECVALLILLLTVRIKRRTHAGVALDVCVERHSEKKQVRVVACVHVNSCLAWLYPLVSTLMYHISALLYRDGACSYRDGACGTSSVVTHAY